MKTYQTSLFSSATLAGLSDELSKIAEDLSKKEKLKKWVKSSLLAAGGSGAGLGAAMLADEFARRNFTGWNRLPSMTRVRILIPLVGLGTIGGAVLARHLGQERSK